MKKLILINITAILIFIGSFVMSDTKMTELNSGLTLGIGEVYANDSGVLVNSKGLFISHKKDSYVCSPNKIIGDFEYEGEENSGFDITKMLSNAVLTFTLGTVDFIAKQLENIDDCGGGEDTVYEVEQVDEDEELGDESDKDDDSDEGDKEAGLTEKEKHNKALAEMNSRSYNDYLAYMNLAQFNSTPACTLGGMGDGSFILVKDKNCLYAFESVVASGVFGYNKTANKSLPQSWDETEKIMNDLKSKIKNSASGLKNKNKADYFERFCLTHLNHSTNKVEKETVIKTIKVNGSSVTTANDYHIYGEHSSFKKLKNDCNKMIDEDSKIIEKAKLYRKTGYINYASNAQSTLKSWEGDIKKLVDKKDYLLSGWENHPQLTEKEEELLKELEQEQKDQINNNSDRPDSFSFGLLNQIGVFHILVNVTSVSAVMQLTGILQTVALMLMVFFLVYKAYALLRGNVGNDVMDEMSVVSYIIKFGVVMAAVYYAPALMQDILSLNNILVFSLGNQMLEVTVPFSDGSFTEEFPIRFAPVAMFSIFIKTLITTIVGSNPGQVALVLMGVGYLIPIVLIIILLLILAIFPLIKIVIWWYTRMFKLFVFTIISPVMLMLFAGSGTAGIAKAFLINFTKTSFEQFFVMLGFAALTVFFAELPKMAVDLNFGFVGFGIALYAGFTFISQIPDVVGSMMEGGGGSGFSGNQAVRGISGAVNKAATAGAVGTVAAGGFAKSKFDEARANRRIIDVSEEGMENFAKGSGDILSDFSDRYTGDKNVNAKDMDKMFIVDSEGNKVPLDQKTKKVGSSLDKEEQQALDKYKDVREKNGSELSADDLGFMFKMMDHNYKGSGLTDSTREKINEAEETFTPTYNDGEVMDKMVSEYERLLETNPEDMTDNERMFMKVMSDELEVDPNDSEIEFEDGDVGVASDYETTGSIDDLDLGSTEETDYGSDGFEVYHPDGNVDDTEMDYINTMGTVKPTIKDYNGEKTYVYEDDHYKIYRPENDENGYIVEYKGQDGKTHYDYGSLKDPKYEKDGRLVKPSSITKPYGKESTSSLDPNDGSSTNKFNDQNEQLIDNDKASSADEAGVIDTQEFDGNVSDIFDQDESYDGYEMYYNEDISEEEKDFIQTMGEVDPYIEKDEYGDERYVYETDDYTVYRWDDMDDHYMVEIETENGVEYKHRELNEPTFDDQGKLVNPMRAKDSGSSTMGRSLENNDVIPSSNDIPVYDNQPNRQESKEKRKVYNDVESNHNVSEPHHISENEKMDSERGKTKGLNIVSGGSPVNPNKNRENINEVNKDAGIDKGERRQKESRNSSGESRKLKPREKVEKAKTIDNNKSKNNRNSNENNKRKDGVPRKNTERWSGELEGMPPEDDLE